MEEISRTWSIVLAGGNGERIRSLTTNAEGVPVPKQYCSFCGGPSLLRLAIERAERVCAWSRITAVVAAQHAPWWKAECADLPEESIVVQPKNRGTAPGVLFPLLAVLDRDPDATVIVIPSDHYVADEDLLSGSIRQALATVEDDPATVALLGMTPTEFDPALGWIVPESGGRVERFVEKPTAAAAVGLVAHGAMWNSFIFAARGQTLLSLYEDRLPLLLEAFREARVTARTDEESLEATTLLYEAIEASDFSRDLLEGSEEWLSVVRANPCGWSDLGTPERVARCVGRLEVPTERALPRATQSV